MRNECLYTFIGAAQTNFLKRSWYSGMRRCGGRENGLADNSLAMPGHGSNQSHFIDWFTSSPNLPSRSLSISGPYHHVHPPPHAKPSLSPSNQPAQQSHYGFFKLQCRRTSPYDQGHWAETGMLFPRSHQSWQCVTTENLDARFPKNVFQSCWTLLHIMLQWLHKQGSINKRGSTSTV